MDLESEIPQRDSTIATEVNKDDENEVQLEQTDHSEDSGSEIETARQKFQKINDTFDAQEEQLKELEERRQKLEHDMLRLQEEIEIEKNLLRQKIESDLAAKRQFEFQIEEAVPTSRPKFHPLDINTDEVESRLKEYREAVEESQLQSPFHEEDADIKRLKQNLATYKKVLHGPYTDTAVKQKRKAATKIFQKHLNEVNTKCVDQINKLTKIQKSIESINVSGGGEEEKINS